MKFTTITRPNSLCPKYFQNQQSHFWKKLPNEGKEPFKRRSKKQDTLQIEPIFCKKKKKKKKKNKSIFVYDISKFCRGTRRLRLLIFCCQKFIACKIFKRFQVLEASFLKGMDEGVSINGKKTNFVKFRILATVFVWQTQKFVKF